MSRAHFNGAVRDNPGLFLATDGGTLFLDEIGDMPAALQVKLLRVLQDRQVRLVGGQQSVAVDVLLISATHRDLEAELSAGRFREYLYYRLKVVSLRLPGLQERREDIGSLVAHFLNELFQRYKKPVTALAPEAMELLVTAAWPGNVRQLYNVVEQSVALAAVPLIPASLVEQAIRREAHEIPPLELARRRIEREYLAQLLKITDGNVTHASRMAKRNRTEFYKLLQRHQLDPRLFKPQRA
jgi:two-component system response regulator GlrR